MTLLPPQHMLTKSCYHYTFDMVDWQPDVIFRTSHPLSLNIGFNVLHVEAQKCFVQFVRLKSISIIKSRTYKLNQLRHHHYIGTATILPVVVVVVAAVAVPSEILW